ncbi:MAG TPA: nucleotide exchange factor GrpE [Acidimicrobiales bacterium]|nr:nucleotide exchange factor GrpE [Acidimicrobiales bacterium]
MPEEEPVSSEGEAAPRTPGVPGDGNGSVAPASEPAAPAEEADQLELLTRQRDEYLLALQRTQADFENYRKRIARQQEEQAARASQHLVDKLLPVLDALDLAENHLRESLDTGEGAKALHASRSMLLDILLREGLERLDQPEVPFDPSVHDAVAHADGEGGPAGETMVEEVMRSGYRWKGQVLRPAMVRVRG